MLGSALKDSSVRVDAEAGDWRAAVGITGELLLASGAVEERYVDAMVRTVEELGAYAVIAPGVAIPHARPEDGAKEVSLSLVVLSEPVEFGSKENDPVDLLFGFSTTDTEAHVELMQALADFIEDSENLEALRRVQNIEEALEVMRQGSRRN